ncbi:TonB-dependent receptor [Parapedobacter sp. 2B3]|uniref:TonB-dependent receptor n=1 Tax=Parapedobacter sp. 2B3 TaxID=3342381 RepID=UPI0035B5AB58
MINYVFYLLAGKNGANWVIQLFRIMRLTSLLLAIICLHVSAKTLSQTVTLNVNRQPITQVLASIKAQTGYLIVYNDRYVTQDLLVSLNVVDKPLEAVLDQVLTPRALTYQIQGKTIAIRGRRGLRSVGKDAPETSMSQERIITGKVTDESGQPLAGVTVAIKGTSLAVTTDDTGNYRVEIPINGNTLVFTIVGFEAVEWPIGNQSTISISMKPSVSDLEEVVVVGYGTQKKVNLTGSVQSITFNDAVNTPVANSAQLMYGKFSGVQLTQNGGLAGNDASSVLIRGVGTFGNTNPLVVIDGIQFDGLREFNQLAPSDIENITVLKDASAGAIYGARGANGVIIVTTKKGMADNFKVELNSYFGSQRPTVVPEFLDAIGYTAYINELLVNNAGGNPEAARYSSADIEAIRNGTDPYRFASTNWTDEILKDAGVHNHYLSFSGGSKKTLYRLSLGYLSQDAIVKGKFKYDRYNFLANVSSHLNNWISVNNNFSAALEKSKGPSGGDGTAATILAGASRAPTVPVRYANGDYGFVDGSFYSSSPLTGQPNPVKLGEFGNYKSEYYNFKERFNVVLEPIKGLTFETSLSLYLIFQDQSDFTPYNENRDWDGNVVSAGSYNQLTNRFDKNYRILNDNLVRYKMVFGEQHDFSFMVGHSVMYDNTDWFSGGLENFPSENLEEFNSGGVSNPSVAGSRAEVTLQSFFSRINYAYKDRYLFEANFRRDGSSRFGPGRRYGNFPSFSAGWRLSEESFLKNILNNRWVNQVKLRGSWGRTGNNRIGNYIYDQTYNSGLDYVLGSGTIVSGAALTSLANPTIRWETTEQMDIGLDASLLSGKVFLEGDYFRRRSFDVLYTNFPVPSTIGVTDIAAQNSAEILNKGVEVNVGYNHRGDFAYQVSANFTRMAPNKVVNLGDRGIPTINNNTIITSGEPFMAYYGYQHTGIFQTVEEIENSPGQFGDVLAPGDLKFSDVSGPAGVADGIVDAFDRVVIGNPYPEWMYGLNGSLSYRGFDMGFTFQGIQNVDRIVMGDANLLGGNEVSNVFRYFENRWTTDNPSTEIIKAGGSRNNVQKLSTYYIEDASFLRLKNVEIGYSFPERWTHRMRMQKLRFYVAGQNLLTFSQMENFDPERLSTTTGVNTVPIYKTVTCGVNIVF